jgi:peptide/nickel transport system substrate-binding protein
VKSPRAWRFTDAIESPDMIEMVDRYTVKLTLKQPFAPFLERLTLASAYVLNQKAVEAAGAEHARQPVGTGPFKLVEQKRGEQITLDRNAEYWGEGAKVDRLVFRPIPDSATRLAELESGGVDHITNLPAEELARLKGEPKVQVLTDEAVNVLYLGYNTRKAPLGNVELRRAMNSAINRDEMLATLYDGVGSVAVSPLNPRSWAFARDAERYDYDPARAAERLAQAGGAPDQPLELAFSQTPETTRAAERIQAQLKDNLGLKVVLKPMEFGTLLNYVKSGNDHQLYILSWSGTGDPDGTLFPLFHSKNFGAAGNRTFYKNERVDELLEKAQRTVDQEARLALYVEAQELIQQDAPWLPIRHGANSAALGPQVKGYRLHPLNTQDFTSVTVR